MHSLLTTSCSHQPRTGETCNLQLFLNSFLCFICGCIFYSNEDWVNTQKVLSSTLRRAAKAALGKDGSRAQKYIMSGIECVLAEMLIL